jgi:hypothetical protein
MNAPADAAAQAGQAIAEPLSRASSLSGLVHAGVNKHCSHDHVDGNFGNSD